HRKTAALLGLLKPTSKPDIDNLLKAVADGMNGIVYADDAAIVSFSCSKVYAAGDGFVAITVRPVSHRVP
ncbi:RusA family crossover junction endodeoxyribonuclease, partial [Klebsiella aerogenes]|uniref:RusA family crossover junction endodeoxyribonuclease n=1 Tax=Klebsiella aerogenes TaxID=548 RepID=UPI0013D71508